MNSTTPLTDPSHFDVREIPCRVKHAQIFDRWAKLPVGQHFVLVNDHDPVPLRYQLEAQFPGAFSWVYLLSGPDEFQVKITRLAASPPIVPAPPNPGPAADATVVLDVRPLPGREKHARIFQRWFDLAVGDYFVLLNDHDPVPLRYQFEAQFPRAYSWGYLETGPDEFRVKIVKLAAVRRPVFPPAPPAMPAKAATTTGASANVQQVDARGLEAPEPLIRILEALETLPVGFRLRAITDREPCHLFGEAEQRGFRHDCADQPDGSWITVLDRA